MMKPKIDRENLEAVASHTIPMLRSLIQTRNEMLGKGIDAFEVATAAAVHSEGDAKACKHMQDRLVLLLGMMTAVSAEMARACVDMVVGTSLEDLVRSHLYNPMPDVTVVLVRDDYPGVALRGRMDDDDGGGSHGGLLN